MDCSDEESATVSSKESEGGKKINTESDIPFSSNCDPVESKSHNGHLSPKVTFKVFAARNLNEINLTDLLTIDENGIRQSDFEAFATASAAADSTKEATHSLHDIMEFISCPKENKIDALGRADFCKRVGSPRVTVNKGKLQEVYGYDIGNETYLYAEEALYLLERAKLEIYCDHVCLSVERARAILLHSKSFPENQSFNGRTCDIDEYAVYKYLTRLGMRVIRHNKELSNTESRNSTSYEAPEKPGISAAPNENMDVDGESNSTFHSWSTTESAKCTESSRGIKRKLDEVTNLSSTCELSGSPNPNDLCASMVDDEEMEACDNPSSFKESDNYTVLEVDSDVEIDYMSTSNGGVVIEEIPDGFFVGTSSTYEERPCSSKTARLNLEPQIFVDLPSSDSESDEEKSYVNQIWSKFVPGVSLQVSFPPSYLLPSSIGSRTEDYQYNFTVNSTDLNLEYFVDELDLNEPPQGKDQKVYCNSWTEWRQMTMKEAQEVRNSSLLASSDFNVFNVFEKLNLWDNNAAAEHNQHFSDKRDDHKFSIIYDIYPQSCRTVHKRRLASHHSPSFHLAIVRSDEPIPSLKDLCPLENDIPIVIAIVSDENEILFLTPESVPLSSLF